MQVNMIDFLTCLESSDKFESLMNKSISQETYRQIKELPKSLITKHSKKWTTLKTTDLEKTFETLSWIKKRIHFLIEDFEGQIDFIEKGFYEIEPPHPYDVFPPNENYQSQWTGKLSEEAQKQEKQNSQLSPILLKRIKKVGILLNILDDWQTEVQTQLIQIKRTLDKNYIEIDESENSSSASYGKVYLKPVNVKNTKSGLSDLRLGLIDLKLISEETKLTDLRRIFGIGTGSAKIVWIGSKVALRHFILELERQNKIQKFDEGIKYKKVAQLFTLKKYPDFNLELLGSHNGKYAGIKALKKIISNL